MTTPSRDLEAIRDQILRLGPWWLCEPSEVEDAVLRTMAAIFERTEGAIATLHDRTFIGRADGSWLDEHGQERGIYRLTAETDENYRPRILAIEDKVTKPAIEAGVSAILVSGVATVEEHLPDGAFASEALNTEQAFADHATAYDATLCFTVYVDEQFSRFNDTAFATSEGSGSSPESFAVENTGDGSWPDDPGSFGDSAEPTQSDLYARIYDTVDRLRAAGVTFRIVVN